MAAITRVLGVRRRLVICERCMEKDVIDEISRVNSDKSLIFIKRTLVESPIGNILRYIYVDKDFTREYTTDVIHLSSLIDSNFEWMYDTGEYYHDWLLSPTFLITESEKTYKDLLVVINRLNTLRAINYLGYKFDEEGNLRLNAKND